MLSTGPKSKWNECLCLHPSTYWALFRPLTHLGELFGLNPFLSLPLIIKPPFWQEGVLDLNTLTEAISLHRVSPRPSNHSWAQGIWHHPQLILFARTLKPSVLELECVGWPGLFWLHDVSAMGKCSLAAAKSTEGMNLGNALVKM